MRQMLGIVALAGTAMSAAGCLQKETTHTLYLSPGGAVAWTTLEMNVYSDESRPEARVAEEERYIRAASSGVHDVGLGLAALDPARCQTRVLRSARPFLVLTDAEFAGIDHVVNRLLSELRIPGYAVLRRDGPRTSLAIHMDLRTVPDTDVSSPVEALAEDLERYRIVLTAGRFVAASGFRLENDGTAAVPAAVSDHDLADKGGVLDLSLEWQQ